MRTVFVECEHYSKSVSDVKVVVGQLSLLIKDPYEKKYSAYSVIIEPSYNSATKANNVAMIQLAEKIDFTPKEVNCIYYDEVDTNSIDGNVLGWGTTFVSLLCGKLLYNIIILTFSQHFNKSS